MVLCVIPINTSFLCLHTAATEVYSFPLFTDQFCDELTAELDHIEASPVPKGRPNSMNNYGVSMCVYVTIELYTMVVMNLQIFL